MANKSKPCDCTRCDCTVTIVYSEVIDPPPKLCGTCSLGNC